MKTDQDDRRLVIEGLRELADFLESTPNAKATDIQNILVYCHNESEVDKQTQIYGGNRKDTDVYYESTRQFGSVTINVFCPKTCRLVTTTVVVTEPVPVEFETVTETKQVPIRYEERTFEKEVFTHVCE